MRTMRVRAMAMMVAAILTMGVSGASAQDAALQPLLDRLERMERDVRLLNLQISRGPEAVTSEALGAEENAPSGPMMARVAVRLTSLEEEVRQLTGSAETLSHDIARLSARLDKLVGDVDFRLTALEGALGTGGVKTGGAQPLAGQPAGVGIPSVQTQTVSGSAPGVLGQISEKDLAGVQPSGTGTGTGTGTAGAPAVEAQPLASAAPAPVPAETASGDTATAAVQPILPPGSAQDRYAFAFGLLRKADYAQAEQALTEFMAAHPDSPLAHNAHYWLGETFYVRAQYARAAEVFLDAFQKSSTGSKAPDTLLKLGMSLAQLDKKQEACASFAKLLRDYPRASTAIKRTVQRESQRISCQ